MRNLITLRSISFLLVINLVTSPVSGQSVTLENSTLTNKDGVSISLQKLAIGLGPALLRFDYKPGGKDVIGIIVPTLWSNESLNISFMAVKTGNGGPDDRFALDFWVVKRFKNLELMVDVGRLMSKSGAPWDFVGGQVSTASFTVEGYVMAYHPLLGSKWQDSNPIYAWAGYHPEKSFFALGIKDKEYWAFAGTRNMEDFGIFSFGNYNPENGNFWFKSQGAISRVNQNFYSLPTYRIAAEYLTIPLFFHRHFSPLLAKGDYTLKAEGRRVAGINNFELMFGKSLIESRIGLAIGINSELKNKSYRLGPSAEVYKLWRLGECEGVIELRYDMLCSGLSSYLILKY